MMDSGMAPRAQEFFPGAAVFDSYGFPHGVSCAKSLFPGPP